MGFKMTDILPPAGWPNVRQLETNEFATGGANGNMNEQAKSLAARSELLKQYAALPYESKTGGYALNERVQLATGDIVRSTIPSNVNNPNENMTGWIKTNSASQIFDESGLSQQAINDNLSKRLVTITPEMFGAVGDGVADDTLAFNTMLDFINGGPRVYSSNVWKSGSGMLVQLKAGASYLIKDTLYIPAWTIIQGTMGLGFNIGSISHKSGLIFDMPMGQTAIASNIFRSDGSRYENNLLLVGTDLDSGAVTSAHGIVLKDLSVFAKNQMYCGIKLQGSPQSILDNVYVENFDYCVVGTSSWASKINVKTRHHKCGVLGANSMNACYYDGYLNPMAVATPQTVSNNFLSQTNMFSGTDYDSADVSVGFALYNNGSGVSNKIVSEKSDLAFAFVSSPFSAQLLHSEGSSINSLYVSGYCTVNVDDHTSVGDSSCIHLGVGAKLYQKKSPKYANTSYYKSVSSVKTVMALAIEAPYHQRVSYNGYNNTLHVSPSGHDSFSGIDGQYPLATLDEALKRASISQTYFNGITQNTSQTTIIITGNGTLSIDSDVDLSRCSINIITVTPQIYPTINVNKKVVLRNSKLLLSNMVLNISSTGGVFINGGLNHVSMGSVTVVLSGSTLFSLSKDYGGIVSASGDKSAISGSGLVFDFDMSGAAKWLVKSCYFGGLIGSDVSKYNIPTAFKDGIIT